MTPRRGVRAFFKGRRGNAATEFAFLLPVMLALLAGVVELSRVLLAYNAVDRLASRYAISYADCSDIPNGTCQTELGTYVSTFAIKNMASQLTASVTLRMFEVQFLNGNMNVKYVSPSGATLTAAELTAAKAAVKDQQFGVVVTVEYLHSPLFFKAIASKFMSPTYDILYTIAQLKS